MDVDAFESALEAALSLARAEQPAALDALRATFAPASGLPEAWNTAFGPGSLFDAWTRSSFCAGIYAANAAILRPLLARRHGWRVVEVGGGDGRLWSVALDADATGELVVVDPMPEAHERVARAVPGGVRVSGRMGRVEDAALPEADAVVMSLTLHHVAGWDADERSAHGLAGPGKREVLEAVRRALAPRGGVLLLNEADVYCDLRLAAGDPALVDHIVDSYVRRCARGLIRDVRSRADADADLRGRWLAVARHWCVDQLAVTRVPIAERDVYELDVAHWLELLDEAGFHVESHRPTDGWCLFQQYVARPR